MHFAKGLTSQLTQEFQQQDTLSTTLNTTNENMTRLLVEMMTSDIGVQSFLTNVYQGLLTSQNITIGKESTSLYIRDMSQTINFSQVFSVVTQQYSSVRASLSDKTSIVDVTEINRINQEYFENLVEEIKDITVNSGIDLGIIIGGTIVIWIIAIVCIIVIYSKNMNMKNIIHPISTLSL